MFTQSDVAIQDRKAMAAIGFVVGKLHRPEATPTTVRAAWSAVHALLAETMIAAAAAPVRPSV